MTGREASADDRYYGPYRTAEQRRRTCGHTHACGCGMTNRGHVDPNYSRQGFCDARCPECDRLDAEGR